MAISAKNASRSVDLVSIAEAKNNLPKLVHEVEAGRRVTLTRRGKPVAVLISCFELEDLQGRRSRFSQVYTAFRDRFDLEELAIDPEEIFTRDRDPGGGREIDWE